MQTFTESAEAAPSESGDAGDAGDAGEPGKQKQKRVRLLSPRKALLVTLQRMEKLAQSNTLKESKAADLLLAMGDLQKMLLQMTLDSERSALEEENAGLKKQVAELNAKLAAKPDAARSDAARSDAARSDAEVSDFLAQLKAGPRTPAQTATPALLDFTGVVEKIRRESVTRSAVPEPTNPVPTNPVPHAPSLRASEATPPKQVIRSRSAIQEELEERERQENVERQRVLDLQWKSQMGLMPRAIDCGKF